MPKLKSAQKEDNVSESTIVISLIVLIAIIVLGFYFFNTDGSQRDSEKNAVVTPSDCEFPASATDLREAGLKLSEEVSGKVGYSPDGHLTIESSNGFVLLTPVIDSTDIDEMIRTQITEIIGCEGTTDLSYWVFDVSDPTQLPPEMLNLLGPERPNQILVVLGSIYVYSVSSLTLDLNRIIAIAEEIASSRSGGNTGPTVPSSGNSPSGGRTGIPSRSRTGNLLGNNIFSDEGEVDITFSGGNTSTLDLGASGGSGSSGSSSSGGRPVGSGSVGGGISGSSGSSGGNCTPTVLCEDPETGDRFTPGRSGCQGADFYAQTPTPPQGTRQLQLCLDSSGNEFGSCPSDYYFHFRNCSAEANERNLAGSGRPTSPEEYDQRAAPLPTRPGEPGTLFTVPPTYAYSPVNYTVRCSYPDQAEAIRCGAPGSGEYCLPGWNPIGCLNGNTINGF